MIASGGIIVFLREVVSISEGLVWDVRCLFGLLTVTNVLLLVFNVYQVATFIENRLDISSMRNLVSKLIWLLVLVLLFGMYPARLWYMGLGLLLSSVYLVIVNVYICRKLTPGLFVSMRDFDWGCIRGLTLSGVWNLITKLGTILHQGCDLILANWFVGGAAMGTIAVTVQVPGYVRQLFGLMSSSFAPSLTKDFAEGRMDRICAEMGKSIRIMSVLVLPVLTVLFVYGDVFFGLWLPSEDGRLLLWLTIAGCSEFVVNMPMEGFWNIFTITNRVRGSSIYVLVNSVVVFVTVIVCLLCTDNLTEKLFVIVGVRNVFSIVRGLFFLPIYGAHCLGLPWHTFYGYMWRPLLGMVVTIGIGVCARMVAMPDSWMTFILYSVVLGGMSLALGMVMIRGKVTWKS
ncbi:MAG: hypothetical protein HUK08_06095 [Bacteroidaceae bacterium]|nr:hypothetical protein [Bacteroidaceae bacterium]